MIWLALLAAALPLAAADSARELAEQLRKPELDPSACYRVRDLAFSREDLRFYFTDGWLIFGKPINGRYHTAVFEREAESGDAEVLLLPPSKGERISLAKFTGSPNLSEHFHQAVLIFSDDTGNRLLQLIRDQGEPKPSAEMGHLLAAKWRDPVINLTTSFLSKLVDHVYGEWPIADGFFYAGLTGRTLGNFDLFHDPGALDQLYAGRLAYRDNVPYYDIWTTFPSRPFRTGQRQTLPPSFAMDNIRIEAVLEENLHLRAVTRTTIQPRRPLKMLAFEISSRMKVGAVRINGEEAEVLERESLRANLLRGGSGTAVFLVAPARPLEPGMAYEAEFEHEGDVILKAGEDVYFVGSRANWYPRAGFTFARHDITFTFPESLQMLFPGEVKEDKTEGGLRTTRRVPREPIRLAGFNLGLYESARVTKGALSVEVFANRKAERALQRPPEVLIQAPPSPFPRARIPRQPEMVTIPSTQPNPLARLQQLADEVASAYEMFAQDFGPPALPNLLVSPIPGRFGQGFPGLLYLSTLTYLEARDRPASRDQQNNLFFSELLHAHETAHQWWGNVVTSVAQQDDWLMESMANYAALMVLEKKKGPRDRQRVLDEYKEMLLARDEAGQTVESTGPLRLGLRLQSSQNPTAWRNILYDKGSWVLHMLRARMGDQNFRALLGDFARRYRFQAVTAEQFRTLAHEYMPKDAADPQLEAFFESWVEGTGIPSLTLTRKLTGKAPNLRLELTLRQSGVEENFSTPVPVVVEVPRQKPLTLWLQSGNEPVVHTLSLRAAPLKVTLDPDGSVLAIKQ
ncbi:MAG: hypothetical protein J0L64_13195 [Acidobacteria bacterium]|nr:hypothetical protein [Acidobacteriota bacterium]